MTVDNNTKEPSTKTMVEISILNSEVKTQLPVTLSRIHFFDTKNFMWWYTGLSISLIDNDTFQADDPTSIGIHDMIWDAASINSAASSYVLPGQLLSSLFEFSSFLDVVSRIESLYLLNESYGAFTTNLRDPLQDIRKCEILGTGQYALDNIDAISNKDVRIAIFDDLAGSFERIRVVSLSTLNNAAFYITMRNSPLEYKIFANI